MEGPYLESAMDEQEQLTEPEGDNLEGRMSNDEPKHAENESISSSSLLIIEQSLVADQKGVLNLTCGSLLEASG